MQSEITFRRARLDDCEAVIALIYSSGPELFDLIFEHSGRTSLDFLRYEFQKGSGFFGYKNHTVALYGHEVAGIGAFYDGVQYSRLNWATTLHYFAYYKFDSLKALKYLKVVSVLMKKPDNDVLYIANVGVAPEMRSKGIGSALLNYSQEIARKAGYKRYELDVATNNPRGQQLYTRLGFQEKFQRHYKGDSRGIELPGTVRMAIDL